MQEDESNNSSPMTLNFCVSLVITGITFDSHLSRASNLTHDTGFCEAHWLRQTNLTGWVSRPCVNFYLTLTHITNCHNYKQPPPKLLMPHRNIIAIYWYDAVLYSSHFCDWNCSRKRSRIFLISSSWPFSCLASYSETDDLYETMVISEAYDSMRQQLSVCCELNVWINECYIWIIAAFYIQSICKSRSTCC